MTVVEELVSVLGLEIGEGALATLAKFRTAVTQGLAGVGGVVAALGAAFAGTVVSVAELGTEINTTALKLGVGTDALQEMKYAADITNVSFDSLTTAMKFLSKNAAEGGDGAKRITEALGGISMRNANGQLKTADELIESFADKVVATKDPIEQVKIAMHGLHGQSGVEIMPLLKLGSQGIRKLREEAIDLGYVLDQKTIASSARFTVSLKHLKNALLGVRNITGAPFIDDFSDALDWMTDRVRKARAWFQALTKDIRDLGQRFARIIEVGKRAFEAIRQFVMQTRLDKLAETVHWVELLEAALIGVGVVAVGAALATAASWLLAAAPFILIATLIGLIVDDIAHFVSGGDSVLGMAVKWSKAFDPQDSNLIKFFKAALALLFDLGDPAKWKRVSDAAKKGLYGILYDESAKDKLYEKHPELLYGTENDPRAGDRKRLPTEGKAFGPIFKKFGEGKNDVETAEMRKAAEESAKNYWRNFGQPPVVTPGQTGEVRYENKPPTYGMDPATGRYDQRRPDFKGDFGSRTSAPVIVNIHGAKDPSDPEWIKKVQEVVDRANSDARAAISGGS